MGGGASSKTISPEEEYLVNAPIRLASLHSDGKIEHRDRFHDKHAAKKGFSPLKSLKENSALSASQAHIQRQSNSPIQTNHNVQHPTLLESSAEKGLLHSPLNATEVNKQRKATLNYSVSNKQLFESEEFLPDLIPQRSPTLGISPSSKQHHIVKRNSSLIQNANVAFSDKDFDFNGKDNYNSDYEVLNALRKTENLKRKSSTVVSRMTLMGAEELIKEVNINSKTSKAKKCQKGNSNTDSKPSKSDSLRALLSLGTKMKYKANKRKEVSMMDSGNSGDEDEDEEEDRYSKIFTADESTRKKSKGACYNAEDEFSESSDGDGDSDEGFGVAIPADCDALAGPNVVLKSTTATSITIGWDVDADTMSALQSIQAAHGNLVRPIYEVQYRSDLLGSIENERSNTGKPGSIAWSVLVLRTKVKGGTVSSLLPNHTYLFRCRRVNWKSDFGLLVSIRTSPGPPGHPSNIFAKEVTASSILISWQPPFEDNGLPVVEYIVSMKIWKESSFKTMSRGRERLYLATGLLPNTMVIFEVKARNDAGEGIEGVRLAIRTLPEGSADMTPWREEVDFASNRIYYCHIKTSASSWTLPKGALLDEVESFRAKKYYLQSRVQRRRAEALHAMDLEFTYHHVNKLVIPRNNGDMMEISLQKLYELSAEELDAGVIRIEFENEDGIDAGGLAKDWFSQVAKLFVSSSFGLMILLSSGEAMIDPRSSVLLTPHENRWMFKSLGIFMAKAIADNQTLGLLISPLLLSWMCGLSNNLNPSTLEDLKDFEPQYWSGLNWIIDNDVTEMELTFSCSFELFGESKIVELKDFGLSISVTERNKLEYVQLFVEWLLRKRFEPGLTSLLEGFHEHISVDELMHFKPKELQMLLGGSPSLEVDGIFLGVQFAGGFNESSPQVEWLRATLEKFDQATLSKFLSFTTGCPTLPVEGLNPALLLTKQSVAVANANANAGANGQSEVDKYLPVSHTCFNQLVLPPYSSMEILSDRLKYAISHSSDGFFIS